MSAAAPRVLVNATSGIGENLLAVPFLRELSRRWPGARVTAAVRFEAAAELFARMAPVEEVLVLDTVRYGTPAKLLGLIRRLRASRFDWCFNLVPANKAVKNVLAMASGASRIVAHGYDYAPLANLAFLAHKRVPIDTGLHDVEQNLTLLDAAGARPIGAPDLTIRFPVTEEEQAFARGWIDLAGLPARGVLGLHPGSSMELGMDAKRWPAESYIRLARELEDQRLAVVVFGGSDERELASELARRAGGAACVGLPLGRLAAMLEACRLVVSNDSFPMHLAAAVGTPVVALFGPTDPARTRPWSSASRVVRLELACSPCWNVRGIGRPFRCVNARLFECVRALPVEQALAACREMLAGSPG
ncbi:MAG: glycosyltransferase family 9 protein [Candidatus Wallbacteria bacterium]|nr:glycosyltransferase family 9 protein [Candidatus Wallbacteria bacterium]